MTHDRHNYVIHIRYIPTRLQELMQCDGCSKRRKRNVVRCDCTKPELIKRPGSHLLTAYTPDVSCATCAGSGWLVAGRDRCPCAGRPWRERCVNCQAAQGCSAMHVCDVQTAAEQEHADDLAAVVVHKSTASEAARRRAAALEL